MGNLILDLSSKKQVIRGQNLKFFAVLILLILGNDKVRVGLVGLVISQRLDIAESGDLLAFFVDIIAIVVIHIELLQNIVVTIPPR
jgi:hypothetical protein